MDIKHNLIIKASTATIYDAVSTKDGIQGWWSKDYTVGEKEGEKYILKFNKEENIFEKGFETVTLEPKKKWFGNV